MSNKNDSKNKKKEQEKKSREKALKAYQKKEKNAELSMKAEHKQKKTNLSDKQQYFENKRKEKKAEELKQKRKARKIKIAAVIVVAAVIVATIPVGVWYGVKSTEIFEKKNYFAETKHYNITNNQMSYYFMEGYESFLNNYSDYLETYGIDENVSPKDQYYDESSGQTWFDYLMENNLEPHIKQLLVFAEAARKEDIKLSDEDKESAKKSLEELDVSKYGDDVSEEEILDAIELELLAQNYYNNLKDSMDFTDEDIEDYFEENKQEFVECDYIYYTISYSSDESDESSLTEEEAYAYAEEATNCKTESELENWIKNNIKEQYPDMSDSDIETQVSNLKVENYGCSEDDDRSDWFCDEDTKVNDTKIFTSSGSYTVVMLLSEPAKNTDETRNVRMLYLNSSEYDDTSEKADEILEEFNNGTSEDFANLVKSYSDDENTKYSGGLYQNVTEDYLVEELNDWTFDNSRKTGDTEVFTLSDGTYIMYYEGVGDESWKSEVESAMISDKYTSTYESYLAKYPVTISEDYSQIKAWDGE